MQGWSRRMGVEGSGKMGRGKSEFCRVLLRVGMGRPIAIPKGICHMRARHERGVGTQPNRSVQKKKQMNMQDANHHTTISVQVNH